MRVRLSRITWLGVVIVVAPVCVLLCWNGWVQSRSTRPLYIPISLASAEIRSGNFETNLSGQYTLTVEAKKTIPFDTLNCLLGVSTLPGRKCDRDSVVRAKWALAIRGKVIQKGTGDVDDIGSWSQDTIERELGTFWLQRGQSYTLSFQSLDDGRVLAPTDPHLKIEIEPDFYEGTMFTSYFLLIWCKRAVIVGCVVLAFSALTWAWERRKHRERQSTPNRGS